MSWLVTGSGGVVILFQVPGSSGQVFELELLQDHGGVCALWAYGNVQITVWYASGTAREVLRMDETTTDRLALFPGGLSAIHIVRETAKPPDPSGRDALVEAARRWHQTTAAVAVVIERSGFWGSAMRSAVTGIQLLAKAEFPIKVHSSVATATKWLLDPHAAKTEIHLQEAALRAAVEKARDSEPNRAAAV